MADKVDLKRRRLLQAAGVGAASLAAFPAFPIILKRQAGRKVARPPSAAFSPDVEIDLVAGVSRVPILKGQSTSVWRYFAKVVKGDPGSVIPLQNTYLGPILKFKTGQRVRITLKNQLPEKHITHWHGLHSPFEADGHPSYAVQPGQEYVYEFEVKNQAGTNWYHPHTNMLTGSQAYAGLAGLIIVEDKKEQDLPLPRGEYDVPLVIQDRTFNDRNQFLYDRRGPISILGFLGERILVNGQPDFTMKVASRAYRFRVLNGSNSRLYKLAWSDHSPVTVIATDGSLLEKPVTRPYIMIGPGQRVEIWRDFSKPGVGKEITLESLEFEGTMPPPYEQQMHGRRSMGGMGPGGMRGRGMGGMGMMGRGMGMMGGRGGMGMGPLAVMANHIPQGSAFTIARFHVTEKAKDNLELPDKLYSRPLYRLEDTVNPDDPRPIAIGTQGRHFTLNGKVFEMLGALDVETIPVNTIQLMEIFHAHGMEHEGDENEKKEGGMSMQGGMGGMGGMGGGMMMSMVHPIHLHGQYFQIVKRTPPREGHGSGYDTVKDGFINEGLHDTVLAMPDERITLIKPFADYKGLFLYHCHNLEHEDAEMMRNFKVV
ncbi:MAG TPA: multicopper oxidase family protein [Methylothermaceae bacterium]|nr:multicopper oxidase family protein [Methylothermaceae bacterium]